MTAMGIILPCLLTVISIVLSVRMHKDNEELQKQIHNRDVLNQTRETALNIYDAFIKGRLLLDEAGSNVAYVFTTTKSYYTWASKVENMQNEIIVYYNRAALIFSDDEDLIKYLNECRVAFCDVYNAINDYISSGVPEKLIREAFRTILNENVINDISYIRLLNAPEKKKKFTDACESSETKKIQELMEKYKELVTGETIDNLFKKYVKIDELK